MSTGTNIASDSSRTSIITIALCYLIAVFEGFDLQAAGVAAPRLGPAFRPGTGRIDLPDRGSGRARRVCGPRARFGGGAGASGITENPSAGLYKGGGAESRRGDRGDHVAN